MPLVFILLLSICHLHTQKKLFPWKTRCKNEIKYKLITTKYTILELQLRNTFIGSVRITINIITDLDNVPIP